MLSLLQVINIELTKCCFLLSISFFAFGSAHEDLKVILGAFNFADETDENRLQMDVKR